MSATALENSLRAVFGQPLVDHGPILRPEAAAAARAYQAAGFPLADIAQALRVTPAHVRELLCEVSP